MEFLFWSFLSYVLSYICVVYRMEIYTAYFDECIMFIYDFMFFSTSLFYWILQ